MVLGSFALRWHSVRPRLAPSRRVRLLHRVHRGGGNDVAGGESELPPSSEIPGLRRHDGAWQWRPWVFSRGLVHPGWHGGVWRRTDLHSGNGGVYRTTEDYRHRRTAGWGSPVDRGPEVGPTH